MAIFYILSRDEDLGLFIKMKKEPVRVVFSNNNFSNECDMYWTKKLRVQGIALVARGLSMDQDFFFIKMMAQEAEGSMNLQDLSLITYRKLRQEDKIF